jgi:hypothetical protein
MVMECATCKETVEINEGTYCGSYCNAHMCKHGTDEGWKQCQGCPFCGPTGGYGCAAPPPPMYMSTPNICQGQKPVDGYVAGDGYFNNVNCTTAEGIRQALEQAGRDVTVGTVGDIESTDRPPITTPFWQAAMCPVNVHYHIGTEHRSEGEYDEHATGPAAEHHPHPDEEHNPGEVHRQGYFCNGKYDASDPKFTTPYEFKYCKGAIQTGGTYEIHWPHSAAGACGTPYQYQTSFYDGVFCKDGIITLDPLNTYEKVGVQAQVFVLVNDESYYYPNLIDGMITGFGDFATSVASYTGATTGTSRSNEICSRYTPITWQVDRKCHLISASSFDQMCKDMLTKRDDMEPDTHPHGAREVTRPFMVSDNIVSIELRK